MNISFKKLSLSNSIARIFLFILILVIPFVHSYSALDPALSIRLFALNVLVLVFCLIAILMLLNYVITIASIFNKKIFKIYLAYLMVSAISIFFAINKAEAIFEWFKLLTFFILFCSLVFYLTIENSGLKFLIKTIVIFALLISLWGFYEFFKVAASGLFDHQSSYFIRAFSANRNLYSQILFLSLPFCLYGIYSLKKYWRILSLISAVLILILITILLVRSVWVALIIALLVNIVTFLYFQRRKGENRDFIGMIIAIVFILLMVILAGLFIYSRVGDTEVFRQQTYWIDNYKFGSPLERVDIWSNSLEMGVDNIIVGVGPGNWRIVFPQYGLDNLRSEFGEIFFQRPHNDFLWVFTESGASGLILYLLLYIIAFYYLFVTLWRSKNAHKRYLSLALIFGLSGYIVISFFSFPKERIEHQIFVNMMLAILTVDYHNLNDKHKPLNKYLLIAGSVLLAICMIIATWLTYSRFKSEQYIAKAYEYREDKKWNKEIIEYKNAWTSITNIDGFSAPLPWYIGEAYYIMNEIDLAHIYFKAAYTYNPYHLHVLNNLGTTYELLEKSNDAEKYYLQAHQIAPRFEDPIFNLCALYYNRKDFDQAYLFIRKIDYESTNPKYNKFLKAILWNKINEISLSVDDRLLYKSVERIRNSDEWMIKVFKVSKQNNIDLDKQILKEAVYLLESVDSTITLKEAESYRVNFNLR